MNKINYNEELKKHAYVNVKNGVIEKVLLHSCCAPCSTTSLERLKEGFSVDVFYYNPNLNTEEEFNKRASEQQRLCRELNINCIVKSFDITSFYSAIKGFENIKEGGARCFKCFYLRLFETAKRAKEEGYEYFATTLTLSPLKNAEKINEIGFEIEKELNVKYLPTDFKKDDGYLRSIELSKKYGLYRQNYCGCAFSKKERETEL